MESQDSLTVSIKGDLSDLNAKRIQAQKDMAAFRVKAETDAKIRLQINIAELESKLAQARRDIAAFRKNGDAQAEIKARIDVTGLQKNIRDAKSALKDLEGGTQSVGRSIFSLNTIVLDAVKAFGALQIMRKVTGLFTDAFNAAISFESAFAGVRKTVEGTPAELEALSQQFRELAKNVPLPVEGLARIGELAGQLGIAKDDIIGFTETIAKLGVTTNLTEEEAATSFARIANIFKQPAAEVERFGSSVVALGNNFATTEQEIVNFATNIAGTSAVVGLKTSDIAALGAAFTSVGVEAEAGGTAVQKTLLTLNEAVVNGGEELTKFAQIAGVSAKNFAELWRSDPVKAFDLFVKGLGNSGDQAANVLDELVGSDVRLTRAFLSLAQGGDILTRAIDTSNKAFADNNALNDEAQKRFETNESKLQLLKTRWNDLAITIGQFLVNVGVPVLTFLTELGEALVTGSGKFAILASGIKAAGVALATYFSLSLISGVARALGSLTAAIGLSVRALQGEALAVQVLGESGKTTTVILTGLRAVIAALGGPITVVVAAMGAIAGAFFLAQQNAKNLQLSLDNLDVTLKALAVGNFDAEKISGDIETITKKTIDQQKKLQGMALSANSKSDFEEMAVLADQQKVSVEELRQAYVDYLTALGATAEQIEAVKNELDFFSESAQLTNKDIKNLEDSSSEVNKKIQEVGIGFTALANKFETSVNAQVSAGVTLEKAISDVSREMNKDFQGIESGAAAMTDNLILNLIKTAAKTGDLGRAFSLGYAGGISGPEEIAAIEESGIQITDQLIATLLAGAVQAGDAGAVAGILHSQGLNDQIPENVDTAEELSDFVTQAIAAGAPNAKLAGQKLGASSVGGIVTGIQKAFPGLSSAVQAIQSVFNGLGGLRNLRVTGIKAIDSQVAGLIEFGKDAFDKAGGLAISFKNAQQVLANAATDVGGFGAGSSGGGGSGGNKAEKALKEAEKAAKEAEKAVEEYNKQIEDSEKRSEKLKDAVHQFYGDIVDDIDRAKEAQADLNNELETFKEEQNRGFANDTAERDFKLSEEEKNLRKEILDLTNEQTDNADDEARKEEKLLELNNELNDILKERGQIQAYLSGLTSATEAAQAEFDAATASGDPARIKSAQAALDAAQQLSDAFAESTRRAGLTEFEQSQLALQDIIKAKEEEIAAEIAKQQKIIEIRQRFLDIQTGQDEQSIADRQALADIASGANNLNAEERLAALRELGFGELTVEQQLDLLKQAQQATALDEEKKAVEAQQAEILAAKEEFFQKAVLANAESIDAMKLKTQELIDLIKSAQIEQEKLNALERSGGGQKGGDTNVSIVNNNGSNVDAEAANNSLLNKLNS